jgi:hypothetical protein
MALPTVAHIRLGPAGTAQVDANLHLTGDSFIACHTYPARPPILHIEDQHVSVSVAVRDSDRVTPDDLAQAHRLADALAAYITGLEQHVTISRPSGDVAA